MTRGAEIHLWLLGHTGRLVTIAWCLFFGVLGFMGQLTTFLLGSSLDAPSNAVDLDSLVNLASGVSCVAVAAFAIRGLLRRSRAAR